MHDLVNDDGTLKWKNLMNWLPQNIQQKITSILPLHDDNGPDARAGIGGNMVDFDVVCMYNNICGFKKNVVDPIWS